MKKDCNLLIKLTMIFVILMVMLIFYSILCINQHNKNPKDKTIPNFSQIMEGVNDLTSPKVIGDIKINDAPIMEDFPVSAWRLISGLSLGFLFALAIGMSMGVNSYIYYLFIFPILILSYVPPTAMMAVYFVLFGTQMKFYTATIAMGIIPAIALSINNAVMNDVPKNVIYKSKTFGASYLEIVFVVIFLQILPRVFIAFRSAIGPALIFLIAAEILTASEGVGYRLRLTSRHGNMNEVYIYLAIIGFTFYLVDMFLAYIQDKLCPWFKVVK